MKAVNIIWDVDYKKDLKNLPKEILIPKDIRDEDEISDYLSDVTGFCHCGFDLVDDISPEEVELAHAISLNQEFCATRGDCNKCTLYLNQKCDYVQQAQQAYAVGYRKKKGKKKNDTLS